MTTIELEDFTFFGRIKKKLKISSIPEREWAQMKRELLTDGRAIFDSVNKIMQKSKMDKRFYRAVSEYYNERINTLPKDLLYDLYISYKSIENSPTKEMEIFRFVFHVNLLYGLEGWFTKKIG